MLKRLMCAALLTGLIGFVGCDKAESKADKKVAEKVAEKEKEKPKHEGWWCEEHGLKEEECSMCDAKVAKAFQAKGDWCKDHNRAKSQCFICDPKLKEKFAAEYVAKYGKQPPEPKE